MPNRHTRIRLTKKLAKKSWDLHVLYVFPEGTEFDVVVEERWYCVTADGHKIRFDRSADYIEEVGPIERLADLA